MYGQFFPVTRNVFPCEGVSDENAKANCERTDCQLLTSTHATPLKQSAPFSLSAFGYSPLKS